MKLIDHRRIIEQNFDAYTKDLESDRLVGTLINHLKQDFIGVKFNLHKKATVKEVIELLFEVQDKRPFFHIEGTELPLCWNRPADWDCDYIKYEWGHLLSRNQNPDCYSSIENLGLYSARCNQHIQSSMNIRELMVYGGLIAQRISNVLLKRRLLFASDLWKQKIESLKQ
ncbi:MAG: hypothetical protein M3R72_00365 [Bacteroidota bacterium]|nr:hypothetical protein [Bacteroidota bacterium]